MKIREILLEHWFKNLKSILKKILRIRGSISCLITPKIRFFHKNHFISGEFFSGLFEIKLDVLGTSVVV